MMSEVQMSSNLQNAERIVDAEQCGGVRIRKDKSKSKAKDKEEEKAGEGEGAPRCPIPKRKRLN